MISHTKLEQEVHDVALRERDVIIGSDDLDFQKIMKFVNVFHFKLLGLFRKNNELSNLDIQKWIRCKDRIIFKCQALGACLRPLSCSRVVVPCLRNTFFTSTWWRCHPFAVVSVRIVRIGFIPSCLFVENNIQHYVNRFDKRVTLVSLLFK